MDRSIRWPVVASLLLAACGPWVPAAAVPDAERCAAGQFEFCLNGVTSSVTGIDTVRVTGSRVSDALQEREKGEAVRETAYVD